MKNGTTRTKQDIGTDENPFLCGHSPPPPPPPPPTGGGDFACNRRQRMTVCDQKTDLAAGRQLTNKQVRYWE